MTQIYFMFVNHFIDVINMLTFKNSYLLIKCQQISLNVKKFELVIFKYQRKKLDSPIKLLNRNRFYSSKSVKYLGIKVDETT